MTRLLRRWGLGVTAMIAAAACGSGGTDEGGGGGGGGAGMTARINAASWSATQVQVTAGAAGGVPGTIIITGIKVAGQTTSSIALLLGYISGPGSYRLGVNQASTPGGTGLLLETTPSTAENRTTPFTGNGGTVVITSLTATRIEGTFSFTAVPILGSTFNGNKSITDGAFDVALPANFTSVPAANHGSTVQANLGATPFFGATVVGIGSMGSYSFGANTDQFNLSFVTQVPVNAAGDYALGGTGIRLTVQNMETNDVWGGAAAATGTVTITSVANGRLVGTFSGTLQPNGQAPGTMVVSNGSFDVRIDATP